MGFFGRMSDSLLDSLVQRELGQKFIVLFRTSGKVNLPTLYENNALVINQVDFVIGVTNLALVFIKNGKIILIIPWDWVLNCKISEIWGRDSVEIRTYLNKEAMHNYGISVVQYPYNHWHKLDIKFHKNQDVDSFINIFNQVIDSRGIVRRGLKIFDKWLDAVVGMPKSKEIITKEYALNESSNFYEDYFKYLNELMDSQRFVYFIGRQVSLGLLPFSILEGAIKEFDISVNNFELYSGTKYSSTEWLEELIEETKNFSLENKNELPFPFSLAHIAKVTTKSDEWQAPLHIEKRLALVFTFDAQESLSNRVLVWNDFIDQQDFEIINQSEENLQTIFELEFGKIYFNNSKDNIYE